MSILQDIGSPVHNLFVARIDALFMDAFNHFSRGETSFDLLCQLFPDWKERLLSNTKIQLKQDLEYNLKYGSMDIDVPRHLQNLFSALTRKRKEDEWMGWVEMNADKKDKNNLTSKYHAFKKRKTEGM